MAIQFTILNAQNVAKCLVDVVLHFALQMDSAEAKVCVADDVPDFKNKQDFRVASVKSGLFELSRK